MNRSGAVVVIGGVAGAIAYVLGVKGWGAVLVGLGAFFAAKWLGLVPRK